ncbi:tetratricopeptide repeat protein [Ottowia sp.]|uniref:O-linked N-acetylglucosamine transferase, SPINDLY family protein n=1 Tax=Ottowia sp. TaxID=1898956 RepID=UPI003A83A11E
MTTPSLQQAAQWLGQGRIPQAIAELRAVLDQQPELGAGWQLLGQAQLMAGAFDEAVQALEKAIELNANDGRSWWALGAAQSELGRHDEAIASLNRALALESAQPRLWYDHAKVLHGAHRWQEALASVERALALQPQYAEAWLNRGNILRDMEQSLDAQAADSYRRAIALNPHLAQAWAGLARALIALNQQEEAMPALERAVALAPDNVQFQLELMRQAQKWAWWDKLPSLWPQVQAQVARHTSADAPFAMLSHPWASAQELLRGARACVNDARAKLRQQTQGTQCQPNSTPPAPGDGLLGRRLRVGYLSGDLTDHAVSYLMAGVFEAHDRTRFEIIGIDICPKAVPDTALRRRVVAAFDQFEECGTQAAEDIAARIRALQLDVLIDLQGATGHVQPGILLARPAPLHVAYLGFPGTSGMDEVDYIVGDRWVCPPGSEHEFSEQVVRLPEVFQANDRQRQIAKHTPTRSSLGLPESGFVFCCLNNSYKVLPHSFDVWMRVLRAVPGSVLWLLGETPAVQARLRAQAQARGVAPERLVFARRTSYAQYLAQYRQADLFLDTLPFNAGTTASDALWAGLPVLCQMGNRFAGRMAASLLHAVGLPELVTHSEAEYETLAVQLATEPDRLRGLRERLAAGRLSSPLFDTERFTRHLESALYTLCVRQRQGLPPASFDVPALPA